MKLILPPVAVVLLIVLLTGGFALDWKHVSSGGSIDLRNRAVGARLLLADRDPYHYKWRTGEPPELCDPYNNLGVPVNALTVTPAVLLLHVPYAGLPYRQVQHIWLIIQWLLLLGTMVIWLLQMPTGWRRWLWAFVIAGFTCTAAWRLHAERGQAYVAMLFLLSLWIAVSVWEKKGTRWWAGLPAGMLIAFRPPLALVVLPCLLLHRRSQWPGVITGLAAMVVVPMLLHGPCWQEYFSAMSEWSHLYCERLFPRPPGQVFPNVIEGIPVEELARFAAIPFADSSLHALVRSLGFAKTAALPLLVIAALLISAWHWLSRGRELKSLLPGIMAWALLIDLFLPALRNIYNDVLILGLIGASLAFPGSRTARWLALAALPLGWWLVLAMPRPPWQINLPTLAAVLSGIVLLMDRGRKKAREAGASRADSR